MEVLLLLYGLLTVLQAAIHSILKLRKPEVETSPCYLWFFICRLDLLMVYMCVNIKLASTASTK